MAERLAHTRGHVSGHVAEPTCSSNKIMFCLHMGTCTVAGTESHRVSYARKCSGDISRNKSDQDALGMHC